MVIGAVQTARPLRIEEIAELNNLEVNELSGRLNISEEDSKIYDMAVSWKKKSNLIDESGSYHTRIYNPAQLMNTYNNIMLKINNYNTINQQNKIILPS